MAQRHAAAGRCAGPGRCATAGRCAGPGRCADGAGCRPVPRRFVCDISSIASRPHSPARPIGTADSDGRAHRPASRRPPGGVTACGTPRRSPAGAATPARRPPRATHADQEVADLQRRAEPGLRLPAGRLVGEPVPGAGSVREHLRQPLVPVDVRGEHRDQRRRRRLVPVARADVRQQPGPRLGRAQQQHPQRLGVQRGRAVPDQVVDRPDLRVVDRLVGEGVGRPGRPEQQVLGGPVEGEQVLRRRGGHHGDGHGPNVVV